MNYVFSFSSRNNAIRFSDAVAALGGRVKMISSPIQYGSGCTLAVQCSDYALCQNVLNCGYYASLRDIYEYDGTTYKSIYRHGN